MGRENLCPGGAVKLSFMGWAGVLPVVVCVSGLVVEQRGDILQSESKIVLLFSSSVPQFSLK